MVALRRMLVAGSLVLMASGAYLAIGWSAGSRPLMAQIPNVDSISPLPSLPPLSNSPGYGAPASAPPVQAPGYTPQVMSSAPSASTTPAPAYPMPSYSGNLPSPGVSATGETIVKQVKVEGNFSTEVSKMPKLGTREGQPFDSHIVQEDVRTLASSREIPRRAVEAGAHAGGHDRYFPSCRAPDDRRSHVRRQSGYPHRKPCEKNQNSKRSSRSILTPSKKAAAGWRRITTKRVTSTRR